MPDNTTNPVLGIDLGTTFSAVARWDGRGPRVYLMGDGAYDLQSAVYYNPSSKDFLVGSLAFNKGTIEPENLAIGIKRKMDNAAEVFKVGGEDFDPIKLSSVILSHLYKTVQGMFPRGLFSSRGTVVTVPYYFKANQCENTRRAAELADINCQGILQEPIAASLSYAWQMVQDKPEEEGEELILVFDLGGGTFDLTLFRLERTRERLLFEVLGSGGHDRLGGMDFDECMIELILRKSGFSLDGLSDHDKRKAWQKLNANAVEAKKTLSFASDTYVTIPYVIGDRSIDMSVTRAEFEESIEPHINRIEGVMEGLWVTSGKRSSDVQRVIRVGGSSVVPRVCRMLNEIVGEDLIFRDPEPNLAVVKGAALYAAHLDDPSVFERTIEVITRTCHGLGVEESGGRFEVVIPANKKAPCQAMKEFGNSVGGMKELDVHVYQGASKWVKDNTRIGTVQIRDLPPRPKGKLDIKVTFDVHADQSLGVTVGVYDVDDVDSSGKSVLIKEESKPFAL